VRNSQDVSKLVCAFIQRVQARRDQTGESKMPRPSQIEFINFARVVSPRSLPGEKHSR
jgi:hypothetical protein